MKPITNHSPSPPGGGVVLHEKLSTIWMETAQDRIWMIDTDYCFVYGNRAFKQEAEAITGIFFNEGDPVFPKGTPEVVEQKWRRYYDRVFDTGEIYTVEAEAALAPAEVFFEYTLNPVKSEQGKVTGIMIVGRDVTGRVLLERSLFRSEEKYRAIAQQSSEMLFLHDLQGNILEVNRAAAAKTGYSMEELTNMTVFDIDPLAEGRLDKENIWNVPGEMDGKLFETIHRKQDGNTYPAEIRASRIVFGQKSYMMTMARDISKRKETEKALLESERQARALLEAIPDMMFSLSVDGVFLEYKASPDELYLLPDDFQGKNIRDLLPGWFSDLVLEKTALTLSTGEIQVFEYQLESLKKGVQWYECRMVPLLDTSVLSIIRNVTGEKQHRQELMEKEANARAIMEATDDVFILLKSDGEIIDGNESLAQRYQMTRAEIVGKNLFSLLPEEIAEWRQEAVLKVVETGEQVSREDFRAGYWNEYHICPIFIDGKVSNNVAVYSRNITRTKQFQQLLEEKNKALMESEEQFRRLFEESPDGIALTDKDYKFLKVNRAFSQMLGYSHEEIVHMTFVDITHPDYIMSGLELSRKLVTGESSFFNTEKQYLRKDGKAIWVDLTVTVVSNRDGEYMYNLAILEDVTVKRAQEEIIRSSEEKYRTLFENLSQGIFFQSANGSIIDANKSCEKMLGLSRDQLMGRTSYDPYWKVVDEDGELLGPEQHPSMQAIRTGKPCTGMILGVFVPKDDRFNWLIIDAIPQFHPGEVAPYQVFASMQDITKRKLAEDALKDREAKLQELNATKDKFFSIIAHDLKSPFNTIIGFSDMLHLNAQNLEMEEINQYAGIICNRANQTMTLLENLLDWARIQQGTIPFHPRKLVLDELVRDVVEMVSDQASLKGISIQNNIQYLMIIEGDENMLKLLFRNLLHNAVKFTRTEGEVTISAQTRENELCVSVSDSGIGMSPEEIGKLFHIGSSFTKRGTKNEKGTGLGLVLCKEFVDRHQGDIQVRSAAGRGTTFTIVLPWKGG